MKNYALFYALVVGFLFAPINEVMSQKEGFVYHNLFMPVAIKERETPEIEKEAKQFEKFVAIKSTKRVPDFGGCFLCVEVVENEKGPPGFVVILGSSGCLVRASSIEQLRKASDAVAKLAKNDNGKVLLPVPYVVTSYQVSSVEK